MSHTGFWEEIYRCTKKHYNWWFVVSAAVLTFLITLNYSVIIEYEGYSGSEYEVSFAYAAVAMLIMIPVYWYLAYRKRFVAENIGQISPASGWGAFIIAVLVCRQLMVDTQGNYTHIIDKLAGTFTEMDWEACMETGYFKVLPAVCILALFGIFIFVLYTINLLYYFVCELYFKFDRTEKLYFAVSLLECLLLIGFFYSRTNLQWTALDRIYQADSAFVYNNYYPVFSKGCDFDWDIGNGGIRHSLMTLYTYPIYLLVSGLANLLFFIPNAQAVLYAVVHSVLMILTVIMLKRLMKSNWIYLIFNLSFPFLFFTVFVEKYQVATFFIVMYVYSVVRGQGKRNELKKYSLIAATGTMTTSAVLGFFYGNGRTLKSRLKEYAELFVTFLLVLVGSGRIHYIWNFAYLFDHNFVMFNGKSATQSLKTALTILNEQVMVTANIVAAGVGGITLADGNLELIPIFVRRLCSFFNLLASCFVPIPYHTTLDWAGVGMFYWESVQGELNIFGVVVFAVLIAVFIKHRRERLVQIFAVWILWAFVQFGIIGFSAGCSPLFSLYFGWAVIPMILIGMKDVLRRPMHQLLGYGTLALVMLYTNYVHLNDLYVFMVAG